MEEIASPGWLVRLGILPLNNEWTHVVASLIIVLGVGAIAVGELFGPPAAAVDSLVAYIFYVKAVHHLGPVLTDAGVHPTLPAAAPPHVPADQVAAQGCHHCHRDQYGELVFRYPESRGERRNLQRR